jgi:prepilin-type N-terminal cleavage/methylation domain-containing protein
MKRGFTMIETIVAFLVLGILFIGPVSLVIKAMNLTSQSQNRLVASYLAQEAVEYALNRRDNNVLQNKDWLEGLSPCTLSLGCYIDVANNNIATCPSINTCPQIRYDDNGLYYNYTTGATTIFTRIVTLESLTADEARLIVIVQWPERIGGVQNYKLEKLMFKWK